MSSSSSSATGMSQCDDASRLNTVEALDRNKFAMLLELQHRLKLLRTAERGFMLTLLHAQSFCVLMLLIPSATKLMEAFCATEER